MVEFRHDIHMTTSKNHKNLLEFELNFLNLIKTNENNKCHS